MGEDRHVIERYTLPEMGSIWSEAHKYELWCRVETLVLEAHARAGNVPAECVEPVRQAPPPTPEAVAAVEAVTQHDVIAFLTAWADNTNPREAAAYVHFGMTSSDLLDTALAAQLTQACDILLAKADALIATLRDHGLAHAGTLRVGRTHGVHAEPDVWGHRVADFAFAMARCRDRLRRAREAVAVGKLSGPVGTYSAIDPAIEAEVMKGLGLRPPDVATQVVMRDGIAEWLSVLALIATVCEAVALEIRHSQRTEIRELSEPFSPGQKGSSAMPHKRNPIRCERICGLARIVRGLVTPVMEGIPLWHERDISHSSVERVALPDAAIVTDYMLHLTRGLIRGLVVDPVRMRANLDATGGLIYTSAVLLELVRAGMSREDSYALVQAAAMDTWEGGTPLRETLRKRAAAVGQPLDEARLDEIFRPERYVSRLGPVFERLARLS
jgi:adenylosuccinate lyase